MPFTLDSIQTPTSAAIVAAVTYANLKHHKLLKAILAGAGVAFFNFLRRTFSRSVFGLKREPYPIETWVAQYEEDAVDPEIAIFDAHHHLWDPRIHDKGWPVSKFQLKLFYMMKPWLINKEVTTKDARVGYCFGSRSPLCCPYMGEELVADIRGRAGRGHKVVGTVYVECGWSTPGVEECMRPVAETDMASVVHRQFAGLNLCCGIVAHADLRLGKAVEPALKYYSSNRLVKGIRHALAYSDTLMGGPCEQNTGYDAKFREGFALLSKYGFSYDCWLFHEQIDALNDLAMSFSDTTIICDHIGFPLGIGGHTLQESKPKWEKSMRRLAKQNNVFVKIGGFGMRNMGFGFDERATPPSSDELAEAWGPFVRFVVELFGVDRCIMESNFPMDKITCSYTVLFNALKKTVRTYSLEDRRKMFELNAKRVYRI
eukprot:TRINITY_DN23525_c0_g1_i1.p1 TRINITY_DN23525_c0_g1~~TRINITY_DN23525_c0_g1_i1.p1  ORF type:complete len:429 (+),score=55.19 TRINITY_DN23525_c0_g1_i1:136-1422(+)